MIDIIMEDDNKIIVFKKSGQLSQSGKSFDLDLVSEVMTYRMKKGEDAYAAIINRLDRPVSGLVLIAKNKKEAARLSSLMQKESFNKQYDAIICGKPKVSSDILVDYLVKDGIQNVSRIADDNETGAKRAELRYQVVKEVSYEGEEKLTLIKIQLITGRHHQIRVQFASRNMALLGDIKYGGREDLQKKYIGRNQIALCASSITVDGKTYTATPKWRI